MRHRIHMAFFILLLVFWGTSCKKTDTSSLIHKWRLKCFKEQGSCKKDTPPKEFDNMLIEFQVGNKFFITSPCGEGWGSYSTDDNGSITISPPGSTLMCFDEWALRYMTALQFSKEFSIYVGTLKLYYDNPIDEMSVMVFKKQ